MDYVYGSIGTTDRFARGTASKMNERHSNKILVQHFDPISLGLVPTVTSIIIHASLHRSIDVNNSRRLIKLSRFAPWRSSKRASHETTHNKSTPLRAHNPISRWSMNCQRWISGARLQSPSPRHVGSKS